MFSARMRANPAVVAFLITSWYMGLSANAHGLIGAPLPPESAGHLNSSAPFDYFWYHVARDLVHIAAALSFCTVLLVQVERSPYHKFTVAVSEFAVLVAVPLLVGVAGNWMIANF